MNFNNTNHIPMLKLVLFLAFFQLFTAQTYMYVNSGVSKNLAYTGYGDVRYAVLIGGRTYTITAGGGDTLLYVYPPSGGVLTNDDWGGTTNPKYSQITTVAQSGSYTLYVISAAGNFNYFLYITDMSPCSTSCTSCQTVASQCSICPTGNSCSSCSGGLYPFGGDCLSSCPAGYSGISGACVFCLNYHYYCSVCDTTGCLSCSYVYGAYQGNCVYPCPSGTSNVNGVCVNCATFHASCTTCSTTSCLSCSGGLLAYGTTCVASCPVDVTYSNGVVCYACSTLNYYCTKCTISACLACSGGYVAQGYGCQASCNNGYYNNNGLCTACTTLDAYCTACTSSSSCTSCSSGRVTSGATCLASCPLNYYSSGGACTACSTLNSLCTSCTSSSVCLACSGSYLAQGSACQAACNSGYYNNNGLCTACTSLDAYCATCTSSTQCTSCVSSRVAQGPVCQVACNSGYYNNGGICTVCSTLDVDCLTCSNSATCLSCDNGEYAYGATCVTSCPANTFNNAGICTACSTLDANCITCNSTISCEACSGGLVALGQTCVSSCPSGTYNSGTQCISCATLDPDCQLCPNANSCTFCANGKLIYGSMCLTSCPQGTSNNGGICTVNSLKISLLNTADVNVYLVQFPAALVNDIQVVAVSKATLVGVATSAYSIALTKQTNTLYQITIQYSQTIPSTTLKFVYVLDGSPPTTNLLIGQWTAEITSKYMAYMSESTKAAVEAVNKVAGGSMKGAATGASSMAILGGNPALLWPLLNLFQAFYYLIFIDVNYPANVQMFLQIFSMGSLSFIPNPIDWFVQNINDYDLPVPKRYNDYNFSGLFLNNSGNELLLIVATFGAYWISKACRKWLRKVPTTIRFATNKTVEWFEWSGILRSLITSYTDIAQAVFLQLRVLSFYSTVFTLSSVLAFLTLGFVVIFPVLIFLIIRRFDDRPELLFIKFETLGKEYSLKNKSSRNFLVIWLVRRLIMCLSLVFLQGYPYVQINILCILMVASILYTGACAPFPTKKENICNTLMEVLFGCIHGVIYVLIYDDHNPSFTDDQRLQMGWVIIFACGAILIISMGLSVLEQIRMVIGGIRLIKSLMSKKDKKKVKRKLVRDPNVSILNEKTKLVDGNTSVLDISAASTPQMVSRHPLAKPPRNMMQVKKIRREKLAQRIRELRQINS